MTPTNHFRGVTKMVEKATFICNMRIAYATSHVIPIYA